MKGAIKRNCDGCEPASRDRKETGRGTSVLGDVPRPGPLRGATLGGSPAAPVIGQLPQGLRRRRGQTHIRPALPISRDSLRCTLRKTRDLIKNIPFPWLTSPGASPGVGIWIPGATRSWLFSSPPSDRCVAKMTIFTLGCGFSSLEKDTVLKHVHIWKRPSLITCELFSLNLRKSLKRRHVSSSRTLVRQLETPVNVNRLRDNTHWNRIFLTWSETSLFQASYYTGLNAVSWALRALKSSHEDGSG